MKKYILLIVVIIISSSFVYSQGKLKKAPFNPEYIEYLKKIKSGTLQEDNLTGAPLPINYSFNAFHKKQKGDKDFPVVYDLRTAGPGGTSLLTPVKTRSTCGCCWTFATYGSIESMWKIMGLGDFDLSENNLKNCHGFIPLPCEWGHHFMSTAYFVRRSGPISEIDDPYSPTNGSCTTGLTPLAYISDARYLPEDHDAFKQTLMDYGAIFNSIYYNSYYRDPVTNTYFYNGPNTTNHVILIAGWNDTLTTAGGQGAWIARNDLGPTWGDGGFFYIAYQDTLVLKYNAFWPIRLDYDPNTAIYQYDDIGGWPFVGYDDTIAWGLVKFTASENQIISKVGTYVVAYNGSLEFEIYNDFNGTSLSNLLGSLSNQICELPGYYTFDLPSPISITIGNDFYIKVRYTTPEYNFPIAIEGEEPGYTSPVIETGKFWASEDEIIWDPLGLGTVCEFDLCIKAYAHNLPKVNLKVFLEGPFNGTDMNTDLNPSFLPLSQPYNISPWNYTGTESIATIPNNDIIDWLLIELRQTAGDSSYATSATKIAKQAAFLLKDGTIVGTDGNSMLEFNVIISDNLYAVIHHRNHLGVMSASPLPETGGVYSYDFTTGADQAYGGSLGHKEIGTNIWGMTGADGDADSEIGNADKNDVWAVQAGNAGYLSGDFTLDTQVNNTDKNDVWAPNSGKGGQVPD